MRYDEKLETMCFSLLVAVASTTLLLAASSSFAADTHKSGPFAGPKANTGYVTHSTEGGKSVLALRLKAATTTESTPYYERFYLGGAYSLRGFADRSLTPVGYGTRLFLGSVEWRVPVAGRNPQKPSFVGAVFFDAGSIGTPPTKFADDDILTAFGFGVRIKVPVVGWLRLDFAYPEKRPDDFRFHLGVGQPF